MDHPTKPAANFLVSILRKIYNPVGFGKGYNAVLFLFFGGALLGFSVYNLKYLDFNGALCSADGGGTPPGECYWYRQTLYYIGIMLHLIGVLPGAILAFFQFVPAIRHHLILYHRIAGHVAILLALVGVAGAIIIAPISVGGGLNIQCAVGVLAILVVVSLGLAYYNIRRKQIDQHRAWMLRAWTYMGTIITLRIILLAMLKITSLYANDFYTAQSCRKMLNTLPSSMVYAKYPACQGVHATNDSVDVQVAVKASTTEGIDTGMSAVGLSFGAAAWLALVIHAIAIEIYLKLTPNETERLRNVSYQRQLQGGMKNPGSAGIVPEKFGDMDPWAPSSEMDSPPILVHEAEDVTPTTLRRT